MSSTRCARPRTVTPTGQGGARLDLNNCLLKSAQTPNRVKKVRNGMLDHGPKCLTFLFFPSYPFRRRPVPALRCACQRGYRVCCLQVKKTKDHDSDTAKTLIWYLQKSGRRSRCDPFGYRIFARCERGCLKFTLDSRCAPLLKQDGAQEQCHLAHNQYLLVLSRSSVARG